MFWRPPRPMSMSMFTSMFTCCPPRLCGRHAGAPHLRAHTHAHARHSRRELYAALNKLKRIIPIWESDENKGGASLEALRQEAREHCSDLSEAYEGFGGPNAVIARFIDGENNAPIEWVRCACLSLIASLADAVLSEVH